MIKSGAINNVYYPLSFHIKHGDFSSLINFIIYRRLFFNEKYIYINKKNKVAKWVIHVETKKSFQRQFFLYVYVVGKYYEKTWIYQRENPRHVRWGAFDDFGQQLDSD